MGGVGGAPFDWRQRIGPGGAVKLTDGPGHPTASYTPAGVTRRDDIEKPAVGCPDRPDMHNNAEKLPHNRNKAAQTTIALVCNCF